jgi:hypothetical protein
MTWRVIQLSPLSTGWVLVGSWGAHSIEIGGEAGGQGFLLFFGQLGVMAGEIEDVDGGFAFGVDEGYRDVALVGAEGDLATRERPRSRRSAGIAGTTSISARHHRTRARRQQGPRREPAF